MRSQAAIHFGKKTLHLGRFDSERVRSWGSVNQNLHIPTHLRCLTSKVGLRQEAARAYDPEAIAIHGSKVRPGYPVEGASEVMTMCQPVQECRYSFLGVVLKSNLPNQRC